ncbi:retrovirus-related pol polyprotein from transposon TNT 1-94 [Tanacetum coccineum]
MLEEIIDKLMFKRKSLRDRMLQMRPEMFKGLFEPRLQEILQLFNATTVVEKDIMLGIVQSQDTIGDDQIDSDIVFDSSNRNGNSGSVEKDTHVPDLYLEAKLKKNVDLILKLGNSLTKCFMVLRPKPLSVYDQQFNIPLNVRDTEDTLDDASKSQQKVVQIVLWIVDSGCSKHMTGLGHNLFIVGQFCDGDLEVAFCSNTCYVRNLEGDDLLTGGHESNLYTISISDMAASSPVCLMSKATSTKSWLWHRRLSHLNFGTINDLTRLDLVDGLPKFKYEKDHLCFACERVKSKKASHPPKLVPSDHSKLELLHMDLCGPMRVASINGKKYILVIVDDYSRYTWVYFLHSKDETPKIIKKFIAQAQLNYKAKVCKIRTDNGTKFKIATLKAHYEKLGIMQQFSTARTPQQNGVVERRNCTLVEAAQQCLSFLDYLNFFGLKQWLPLFGELTTMASEHDCLEPELQRFNNHNSSAETMNTPSKEDLDNLFGLMFEEYFEKKFLDTPINSAAQPTQFHEDSPSTYSIIVDKHEASPIFVPYNPPGHEEIESSTMALEPSNVHNFYSSKYNPRTYIWQKLYPPRTSYCDPSITLS